ncbi:MAG: hypothetical protein QOF10_821 [Kribbellaceae bacterium]|jgi:hypothetical protein|nr:hypothetical protein [Kribbellaceae bacterium]
MTILRLTRFTVEPSRADEMLEKRADLITAVRAKCAGPTETRLARVDEQTWLDLWRWDSDEALQEAVEVAHGLPEAPAAFAMVQDPTAERVELVDER